jgi:hypothetical protein
MELFMSQLGVVNGVNDSVIELVGSVDVRGIIVGLIIA